MSKKIGEDLVNDMLDRGRREIGGLWPESNIAQPMYPLRGSYGLWKESEAGKEKQEKTFEELHPAGPEEPGRDDPDRGIERE
jgi:hypothetical protein